MAVEFAMYFEIPTCSIPLREIPNRNVLIGIGNNKSGNVSIDMAVGQSRSGDRLAQLIAKPITFIRKIHSVRKWTKIMTRTSPPPPPPQYCMPLRTTREMRMLDRCWEVPRNH